MQSIQGFHFRSQSEQRLPLEEFLRPLGGLPGHQTGDNAYVLALIKICESPKWSKLTRIQRFRGFSKPLQSHQTSKDSCISALGSKFAKAHSGKKSRNIAIWGFPRTPNSGENADALASIEVCESTKENHLFTISGVFEAAKLAKIPMFWL